MKLNAIRNMALLIAGMAISVAQASAAPTGHFERTLKVSGQVDLEINSGSGNVNVHVGSNDTVQVSAKIHASNNGTSWLFGSGDVEERIRKIEQNPPIQQQGNMVVIGRVEDRELLRNISIDYDVAVPAQTRLQSQTGSGDQTISGLHSRWSPGQGRATSRWKTLGLTLARTPDRATLRSTTSKARCLQKPAAAIFAATEWRARLMRTLAAAM